MTVSWYNVRRLSVTSRDVKRGAPNYCRGLFEKEGGGALFLVLIVYLPTWPTTNSVLCVFLVRRKLGVPRDCLTAGLREIRSPDFGRDHECTPAHLPTPISVKNGRASQLKNLSEQAPPLPALPAPVCMCVFVCVRFFLPFLAIFCVRVFRLFHCVFGVVLLHIARPAFGWVHRYRVLRAPVSDTWGSSLSLSKLSVLKTELDGYVAAECVLCGDMMVQSVDKPLVTEEEQAEQSHQWAL